MNKFYIQTLGCRLNQAETQELVRKLIAFGWQPTDDPAEANLIVINGCVVTHKAERESRQLVRRLRRLNPQAQLVAAGCWADKIRRFGGKVPEGISQLIGNQEKWNLEELRIKSEELRIDLGIKNYYSSGRALVWIQKGCHNQCSYCLTRLVRGASFSRPREEIIAAIKAALRNGAQEIVLTGQNLSQYWYQEQNWIDLIERIFKETEVQLLRLGSINPLLIETPAFSCQSRSVLATIRRAAEKLVVVYRGVGKNRLARHLHLSLQSGSDRILKLMRRNYTTQQFAEVVNVLRSGVPGINITTDIIVGFPGEKEKDFQSTLDFVRQIRFGKIHIFRYSTRKGTWAANQEKVWGLVSEEEKRDRARRLRQLEQQERNRFWQSQLGQELKAIIWPRDSANKSAKGNQGLTDNYLPFRLKQNLKLKQSQIGWVRLVDKEAEGLVAEVAVVSQSSKR